MSYIDVAIPLMIGLLLAIRPNTFVRVTASQVRDLAKEAKLRKIGFVLLAVAALYLVIKVASA